jgi:DNA-binding CsgD family transcriptional regulator
MGMVMSWEAVRCSSGALRPPGTNGATSVLLHDEPPAVEVDPAQSRLQPALLVSLLAAETPAQRQRAVKTLLQSLGFEWLGYGRFSRAADRPPVPLSFCTTYADPAWVERYFAESYHLVDPRLRRVPESGLPAMWTLDELEAEAEALPSHLHGLRGRFFGELRATGACSGVMMSLPGMPGRDRHVISLLSRRPDRDWMTDALLGQVLTLALCLHEFYSRYVQAPQLEAATRGGAALTPLQCEILARLARGMPDKLIAAELELSLHNVDYHMRQLRKRFGVRNRLQLMQAAHGTAPPQVD